jgi:drug/metabolite transporter (DMT)-like permease
MTKLGAILLVVICTIVTSVGQILWKFGANRLPEIITNWPLILGFVLHIIAAGILITSFKTGEVSVLFPMYATNYVWVSLLSRYYFGEPLNAFKWAGMAAVIIGVVLLGRGAHKHGTVVA